MFLPKTGSRVMRAAWRAASPSPLLALAVLGACLTAAAQPAFEPTALDEPQRQIVEQIRAIRARDGVTASGQIPPLTELAVLYEQSGEPAFAIAALDEAMQLIRVDRGVHALDQAPLLAESIRIAQASGAASDAWEREQDLVQLAGRHPEDLRTVQIFRDVADRRIALFERWNAGEYPQELVLGEYCSSLGQIVTCRRRLAARQLLGDAQYYYAEAIAVLLRNALYSTEELRALEMELVRSSDLPRQQPDLLDTRRLGTIVWTGSRSRTAIRTPGLEESDRDPFLSQSRSDVITDQLASLRPSDVRLDPRAEDALEDPLSHTFDASTYYEFGRRSLRRLYDYEVASEAPLVDQLNAVMQIADWDLLYSRNTSAFEGYELVHAWLEEEDARAAIDDLFAPRVPVVLPAFGPNPFVPEDEEDASEHVDVTFTITKYGQARRVRILGASANVTDSTAQRVASAIRGLRFRPRLTDGELGRATEVVARYYAVD